MNRVLAVALAALAGLVLTVCSDSGGAATPTPTPPPTPTPTPTPTPVPAQSLPDVSVEDLLQSAVAAMQQVDSIGFDMNIQVKLSTGGQPLVIPIKLNGDIQRPDRMKGQLSLSAVFITIKADIISIGGVTYFTDITTGEWTVMESDAPFFVQPDQFLEALPAAIQNAVLTTETLDDVPTFNVSGVNPPGVLGLDAGEFEVSLWIGAEDRLLRQVTIKGESDKIGPFVKGLGGLSVDAKGSISLTLKLRDIGKPVSIEAPQVGSK